ncbi:cytochrome P450 94A2-like [Euphorbia lathyris]|uniref:cytochrome P450 94A2-like n=1 Tax=Euphorbia lathyris TaxID=212925 RepID=UPI0033142E8E
MSNIYLLFSVFLFLFSLIFIIISSKSKTTISNNLPKSYPIIGSAIAIKKHFDRRVQWTSDILQKLPSATFVLHRPLGHRQIFTGNPANVQHILKTHFHIYHKGPNMHYTLFDFLGNGILNADGDTWKFQRQIASHEFNTMSLRKFIETVVDTELSQRLIPILSAAAANETVLDLQDIFQRFAFDNICKIAFGYDPEYLLQSLPVAPFAEAFEETIKIISDRFNCAFPIIWKMKKFFCIGSEKRLKEMIPLVRDLATNIVKEKKAELKKNSSIESLDILSRLLSSGVSDENFVTDVVISFILAGRDTTSVALTWFFWLISCHQKIESTVLEEISDKSEDPIFEEVKDMVYTHACLCETMRLYPPVPVDNKMAKGDDIFPDGTQVKKGTRVTYHPYAMGRMEALWGPDWAEFMPERWLVKDEANNKKWNFVAKDPYSYPVFQAGPRVCLGKEMAFLQMKRVVAGVLSRFEVVPAADSGEKPVYIAYLTSKMEGGFPVRIKERAK